MKTEHILIIRFSALGDVAMLVPVVHALATEYPHLRVTVLSRPFARVLFDGLAPNVGFMSADLHGEDRGLHGLNALYRRLVAKKPTAVADMHNVLRTRYLRLRFRLGRFPVACIDKHRSGKRALTRQSGKRMERQPSSVANYADVLARLGWPVTPSFSSLFSAAGADPALLPADMRPAPADGPWIGVAPFAAHAGKIYPLPLMRQTILLMARRWPEGRIFLFGGRGEEARWLDAIAAEMPRCVNASARLGSLERELALMSHLRVMVSMDSANMHLASLTATPVVSVWGATHPWAGFMGWRQSERLAVQADMPCRPCSVYGQRPCRYADYRCLAAIRPEDIVERVALAVE